ncbi:hypothetical protein LZS94_18110 [Aliivibrio fischeri]|uniref:Uncharacterized protein n=1 Tax=Aliivibrio sifiae TaxID=566293 RepID=A0A2S7X2J9_9GAMM|nr:MULTISPECIES: hypothetical protein [Aliivibrio]MCE7579433.1 hypothetical protein [Aliivibrio fischeri]MCE7591735.1 hypothetical protein [Aliivibrio fischeri]OCH57053.1 hypothetical protein A6D98_19760 [Aliivibrio fischeri]PQJ84454.1 hypothetical protein BTO22_13045 [Aliivibrio sifiae]
MNCFSQFRLITYQLLRPFSYLSIKHEDKWIYDWFIPMFFTAVTSVVVFFFMSIEKVVGQGGLISELTSFVANLPGFFIAALAAVATFNKHDIDDLMANSPKIEIYHHGNSMMIEMTRRRFLCVLFSYLTAVSIFLVLTSRIFLSLEIPEDYFIISAWGGFLMFMFFLWQMILATVLGLYYLGERLHTPQ